MKKSDIEEFKAILYLFTGVVAYHFDLIIIAILAWVLASLSLLASCLIAYLERKKEALKSKLE